MFDPEIIEMIWRHAKAECVNDLFPFGNAPCEIRSQSGIPSAGLTVENHEDPQDASNDAFTISLSPTVIRLRYDWQH
jgi:hypothetical protein